MYQHPLLNRDKMSPQEALDILVEGNHRFTNNLSANKDMLSLVHMTTRVKSVLKKLPPCSTGLLSLTPMISVFMVCQIQSLSLQARHGNRSFFITTLWRHAPTIR